MIIYMIYYRQQMDMATTDLQNLSVDELIELCKERGLDSNDYLTQKEKPRAKSVLIRNIEKDKAYKANLPPPVGNSK